MPRPVAVVAASIVAAALFWAVRLALDPEPFAPGPGAVLAVGGVILSLVSSTGILVARGRWSRWLAAGVIGLWLGLSVAMAFDPIGIAALALSGVAAAGIAGPWLRGWLRHHPSAEGPTPFVTALVLSIASAPMVVALALPSGLGVSAWTLVGCALLTAWLLSRATLIGLWWARIVLPSVGIWVTVAAGLPGGPVAGLVAVVLGVLAWRRELRLAVDPLSPPPVERTPFPPELVPPEILEAAGYDDRGRPREEPE